MYIIYGRSNCPYCDKAKELLSSMGIDFTYINVQDLPVVWRRENLTLKGFTTLPQIFRTERIGGYSELEALINNPGT